MNLAVLTTKTNEVSVFDGKKRINYAQFGRPLYPDEIEAMRANPEGFLKGVMLGNDSDQEPSAA